MWIHLRGEASDHMILEFKKEVLGVLLLGSFLWHMICYNRYEAVLNAQLMLEVYSKRDRRVVKGYINDQNL